MSFASLIGYFERLIVRFMIDMFIPKKKKKISSLIDKENEFPNYEFQGFPSIIEMSLKLINYYKEN